MLIDLEFITYVYGYRILFDYEDRIRLWYILFLKDWFDGHNLQSLRENEDYRKFEIIKWYKTIAIELIDIDISMKVDTRTYMIFQDGKVGV